MRKALVCLLLALACTVNAETIIGRVVGVADGDTITVLDADKVQHKIRLSGIDAPEKKPPFGNRSKESLSELAFDKTVNVETENRDRYGRQIGKVLVNGRDVNLVQVERSMAWFYRQYQRDQSPNDRRLYEAAEDAARADKRGLWRDADPVPPWEFGHNEIKSSNCRYCFDSSRTAHGGYRPISCINGRFGCRFHGFKQPGVWRWRRCAPEPRA